MTLWWTKYSAPCGSYPQNFQTPFHETELRSVQIRRKIASGYER